MAFAGNRWWWAPRQAKSERRKSLHRYNQKTVACRDPGLNPLSERGRESFTVIGVFSRTHVFPQLSGTGRELEV